MSVVLVGSAIQSLPTSAVRPMRERGRNVEILLVAGALTAVAGTSAIAETRPAAGLVRPWTTGGVALEPLSDSVTPADSVVELHRRSGLTWEHIARIFGVDRRSVHLWASGRTPSVRNAERLSRVLAALRAVDLGDPVATRHWLLSPLPDRRLPFDLLVEGDLQALLQVSRPRTPNVGRRPTRVSAKVAEERRPLAPDVLATALPDRAPRSEERLVSSTPFKTK